MLADKLRTPLLLSSVHREQMSYHSCLDWRTSANKAVPPSQRALKKHQLTLLTCSLVYALSIELFNDFTSLHSNLSELLRGTEASY